MPTCATRGTLISCAFSWLHRGLINETEESGLEHKVGKSEHNVVNEAPSVYKSGLILGLRPANKRRRNNVTASLVS